MHTSDNIRTLEELVEALEDCGYDKTAFSNVFHRLELDDRGVDKYSFWEEESYTRNCVFRNDDFELVLFCWDEDSATPIHDHGGQMGWAYVVKGEISEDRYVYHGPGKTPDFYTTTKLGPGQIAEVNDALGIHRMHNSGIGRAITLHLYARPIVKCPDVDEKTGNGEVRELSYYSVAGEIVAEAETY